MSIIEFIIRYVAPILSTVVYLVGFTTAGWVVVDSDEITWGLWTYCDNESFISGRRADCHYIGVGDSDAYFEAVRVVSCFTLLLYIGIWMGLRVFIKNLEKKKGFWFSYLVCTCGMTVTMLAVMGALYEEDSRWKNKDPELGYSFWLTLAAAILAAIGAASVIIFGYKDSDSGCDCDCDCDFPSCSCFQNCCAKKKLAPKVSPFALQPVLIRRAPPRSPSPASSCSLESSSKITSTPLKTKTGEQKPKGEIILRVAAKSPTPPPPPRRQHPPPPQPLPLSRHFSEPAMKRQRKVRTPSPPRPPPVLLSDSEDEVQEEEAVVPRCRRLPAITLPQYDLPPEPRDEGCLPSLPPPAYEEVVATVNETDSPDVSYPEDV